MITKSITIRDDFQIDGDKDIPLYKRLYRTIARRIAEAEWRPGDVLPSEVDLARNYGVAPGTMRKAIDALADDGLIERRHGCGTFIRRPNFDNMMLRFFLFRDAQGRQILPESELLLREAVLPPRHIASHLKLDDGERAIKLIRHRHWEEAPRLLEDIYLPLKRFEALMDHPVTDIGPLLYPEYERLCGELVCFIAEEIRIEDASIEDAVDLRLSKGELVVAIERLAKDAAGWPIEWRVSRGEARRFRYRLNVN